MPFRFYIIDDYCNVSGTDDATVARAAFFSGEATVIDAQNGESFEEPGPDTTGDIRFVLIQPFGAEATP
ncbi:MAG: hypothetical protein LLG08_07120 [Actinomycetia bacterium]|nr:hypothetical protein [Actinomycetes bacterium]